MTELASNSAFHARPFLNGANFGQLAARHAADPASADAGWAEVFRALGGGAMDAKRAAASKIDAMKFASSVLADSPAHPGAAVMKAIKG